MRDKARLALCLLAIAALFGRALVPTEARAQEPADPPAPPAEAPTPPPAPPRDELLHYEPPSVDAIFPLSPGETAPPPSAEPEPPPPAPEPDLSVSPPPLVVTPAPSAPEPEPPTNDFGARAKVVKPTPGTKTVDSESARDLPGAFGDPLRILDSLPGMVPIASGVPYVYMRGAPPAAQGYVYDDIPLPQLFHAAFGPAVIHPRTTGNVKLYAGVPPARYGRRAGGLLMAEGLQPQHTFSGEIELRLIDMGFFVETPIGDSNLQVSGRIGYPKLGILAAQALNVMEPGTKLNYWDGQVRYRMPLGKRDYAELVWLGSFDGIDLPGVSSDPKAGVSRLEFHRVETRLVHSLSRGEVGAALRFGYDQSELGDALKVRSTTIGPRIWSRIKIGAHTLRAGGDIYTSSGIVRNGNGKLGSPQGEIAVSLPTIAQASARNQGGVWTEANIITSDHSHLEAGLRLDYWSVQSKITVAVDPRARFIYDIDDKLNVHAAFGLAHQPAVFLLPVPGLTDVALDKGLTSSIQSEIGASYQLPYDLSLDVQGFLHHYEGLLLPELVEDGAVQDNPPLVSANAYGTEFFLRRPINNDLSGWISYTLGFAMADSGPDVIGKFRPDFDVRHVINTVVHWRVWKGLTLGSRAQFRSGRLIEQANPRYAQRLPWFTRVDVRVGYRWQGRWCPMLAYIEWLNVFVRREYIDADCFFGQCVSKQAPPISLPNLGVRAEF